MIGRVFKQATCIRAWLGEHADNSEALFDTVPESDRILWRPWAYPKIVFMRLQDYRFRFFLCLAIVIGLATGIGVAVSVNAPVVGVIGGFCLGVPFFAWPLIQSLSSPVSY